MAANDAAEELEAAIDAGALSDEQWYSGSSTGDDPLSVLRVETEMLNSQLRALLGGR